MLVSNPEVKGTPNAEPLMLAIESCTRAGSVCLARGGQVLGSAVGNEASSHSTDLIPNVQRVLDQGNTRLSEIDLFSASIGPGSFTGMRIGLATVKAFAVSSGRPCAAVSTLAAIAFSAGASERTLAILPAGRGEVYAQMFRVSDAAIEALDDESHIDPKTLVERYAKAGSITVAGEGASRILENQKVLPEWTLARQSEPLACAVAALALRKYRRGELVAPEGLRANYVRPSDAEIKERWPQRT